MGFNNVSKSTRVSQISWDTTMTAPSGTGFELAAGATIGPNLIAAIGGGAGAWGMAGGSQ